MEHFIAAPTAPHQLATPRYMTVPIERTGRPSAGIKGLPPGIEPEQFRDPGSQTLRKKNRS